MSCCISDIGLPGPRALSWKALDQQRVNKGPDGSEVFIRRHVRRWVLEGLELLTETFPGLRQLHRRSVPPGLAPAGRRRATGFQLQDQRHRRVVNGDEE
eukprot:7067715-Lingulodinium_polyedra.AAC.1